MSSSGSWSARNSVCAAGPSSRMAGAARSPASAAARTARNCDSTPRRSADATAAPPSSSSAAPAAISRRRGRAAAACAGAPVSITVSASLVAGARGRPSTPGAACGARTSSASLRTDAGAESGRSNALAQIGNKRESAAAGSGSSSFISTASAAASSAFCSVAASAVTRVGDGAIGSPRASSGRGGAEPLKDDAESRSAAAIISGTPPNPRPIAAFPGTPAAATTIAAAHSPPGPWGKTGESRSGRVSAAMSGTRAAAAPRRVPPRIRLAVSRRRSVRRSTSSRTLARTAASSFICAWRASSSLVISFGAPPPPPPPPGPFFFAPVIWLGRSDTATGASSSESEP